MTKKRQFISLKGQRSHFSYAIPLQQIQNETTQKITGQTQGDNQQAAKRFKLMLGLGEDYNEEVSAEDAGEGGQTSADALSTIDTTVHKPSRFELLYGAPTNYMNAMLAKAYRESYRRHKIDPEEYEDADKDMEEDAKEEKDDVEAEQFPIKDKARGRKKRVKKVTGQRTGLGVIGQPFWTMQHREEEMPQSDDEDVKSKRIIKLVPLGPPTYVVPTMLGCDIPVPFEDNPSPSAQFMDTLKKSPFLFKPDLTLPPLALEHPARVWNVMYHSLEPSKQPLARWTITGSTANEEVWYRANLTLRPPGTNSSVVGGWRGTDTWTGMWQSSKVEAMNDTLATGMGRGLLKWLVQ